jgi:hypothetical protein
MKTTPNETNETFAGFNYPKHQWSLDRLPLRDRLTAYKQHKRNFSRSGYYQNHPRPLPHKGWGVYHTKDFMPGRWQWADEISDINHTGWWIDAYQSEKIRGFVIGLNHDRGFLAGWSMGEGMCAEICSVIYDASDTAAYAADSMAEQAAIAEREYQKENREI